MGVVIVVIHWFTSGYTVTNPSSLFVSTLYIPYGCIYGSGSGQLELESSVSPNACLHAGKPLHMATRLLLLGPI